MNIIVPKLIQKERTNSISPLWAHH